MGRSNSSGGAIASLRLLKDLLGRQRLAKEPGLGAPLHRFWAAITDRHQVGAIEAL